MTKDTATKHGFDLNDGIHVIKPGGSVITDRTKASTFNRARADAFCRCLAHSFANGELKHVVLAIGGGSFAHDIVRANRINEPTRRDPRDLFKLPASLFALQSRLLECLSRAGVPALPFHPTSLMQTNGNEADKMFFEPLYAALAQGFVPVLTGGLVFDQQSGFKVFSSDWLPVALSAGFQIKRFVVLTDQPGIRVDIAGSEIFSRVTQANFRTVERSLTPGQRVDVTRGMNGKLDALLQLARRGVSSVVCDGRNPTPDYFDHLFSAKPPGTVIEAWDPDTIDTRDARSHKSVTSSRPHSA
ncbi:MAG: hypothetical protein H6822_19400 [Planctomycetaceae bacterium]|nr:hypothetical protein [Planctomycetales bacterium]MCB9924353.1 hypothetical protein [Planctomycetaceae bacterium]